MKASFRLISSSRRSNFSKSLFLSVSCRKLLIAYNLLSRDDRHLVRISVREIDESQQMQCELSFRLTASKTTSDTVSDEDDWKDSNGLLRIYEVTQIGLHQ